MFLYYVTLDWITGADKYMELSMFINTDIVYVFLSVVTAWSSLLKAK